MDPAPNLVPSNGPKVGYVLKMFPRLSETFILNELLELERQGVDVSVFSLMYPSDGRFHGRLAELQLTARYYPSDRPEVYWAGLREFPETLDTPPRRLLEATEFLRRHGIPKDLELLLRAQMIGAEACRRGIGHLHAHFATVATRMAAVASILTGIPFSFTAHAKDIFRSTVDRKLFAELVDRAAFCVTVSDFNREYILSHTDGVSEDKIVRLYNGIDLKFFSPDRKRRTPEVPRIISVGRLVPKKGFHHLLRALKLCKDDGFNFQATIVGDGEALPDLLDQRRSLGLTDEVEIPGSLPQEKVRQLCNDASLVALACVPDEDGNMDALPTVLLEALALDLPIVSTRLTGIPEIVGNGTGILVEPGNEPALSRGIREMWDRVRSGRWEPGSSRRRAEQLFDLRHNVSFLREQFCARATSRVSVR